MAFSLARMFSWPNSADFGILEKKLEDPCATPVALPLDFLKHITGDFSKEQELGRGGGFFFFLIGRERRVWSGLQGHSSKRKDDCCEKTF